MSRSLLLGCVWLLVLSAAFSALHANRKAVTENSGATPSRAFEFTYQVHMPGSSTEGISRLWIPLPPSDGYQDIRDLRVESIAHHIIGRDAEYGNPYAVFTPTAEQSTAGYDVLLRFTTLRREHRVVLMELCWEKSPASCRTIPCSGAISSRICLCRSTV